MRGCAAATLREAAEAAGKAADTGEAAAQSLKIISLFLLVSVKIIGSFVQKFYEKRGG
jgi:hypothetical protein